MAYFFFMILVIMWVFYYRLNDFKMVRPSIFFLSVMVLSTGVYLTAFNEWGVSLSLEGILILLLGFLLFTFGEIIGISFVNGNEKALIFKKNSSNSHLHEYFSVNNGCLFIAFLIILITIKYNYDKALELALLSGFDSDDAYILGGARHTLATGNGNVGVILGLLNITCNTVNFMALFIFINNFIQGKKNFIYLILSIMALIPSLLFGARIGLINYTFDAIFISALLLQINHEWHFQWKIKQILSVCISAVLMLIIFLFLGTFTGKVDSDNILSSLQIYIAFPVQGVDYILQNENFYDESIFGQHIFARLFNLLFRLNIMDENYSASQPFAYFNGHVANTYSATGDWLIMAGLPGVIIGQFLIGLISGIAYNFIRKSQKIRYFTIVYCYFGSVFLDRMTAERFFNQAFDFSNIIMFFMGLFFYRLIHRKNMQSDKS